MTHQSIYLSKQIYEIERSAQTLGYFSSGELMQQAGDAAFHVLLEHFPQAKHISIIAGTGNNAGDGYVLASKAQAAGLKVTIWQINPNAHYSSESKQALLSCQEKDIPIHVFKEDSDLGTPDLIVDAIGGIGFSLPLKEEIKKTIQAINALSIPILALDIPTGVAADTGDCSPTVIHAAVTVTFIAYKIGLLTGEGVSHTGKLILNELNIPQKILQSFPAVASLLHFSPPYLPPRLKNWHKGLSGHVVVVGGAKGFSGAPLMSGLAAMRMGAGLVSVALFPNSNDNSLAAHPELMIHDVTNVHDLSPLLDKATVIVIGPGLGQSDWSKALWLRVLQENKPLVVDADALHLLAESPLQKDNWILTPHPGEAAHLLNMTTPMLSKNRLEAVKVIAKNYGGICVLKGAGTLICNESQEVWVCDKGNPGMSTAGMGDILTGVIASLLAQGLPLAQAASLGVYLHAIAGDKAAQEGGERGLMATDLLPYLRQLSNS